MESKCSLDVARPPATDWVVKPSSLLVRSELDEGSGEVGPRGDATEKGSVPAERRSTWRVLIERVGPAWDCQ